MKTTYKLNSEKMGGYFLVSFENEDLTGFEICFKKPLTVAQYTYFLNRLPVHEGGMNRFESIGLSIEKVAAPNEKIAMFCALYEKHVGIKYKVSPADSGKIKHVQVTEELLHHYFRSDNFLWKGKYSIANLVKYYNELRAEIAQGGKARHPDQWDKAYFAKLQGGQISEYFRHLRELGLKPHKNLRGDIVDWK